MNSISSSAAPISTYRENLQVADVGLHEWIPGYVGEDGVPPRRVSHAIHEYGNPGKCNKKYGEDNHELAI